MAASEHPARPKPAFVYMVRCIGGQLYTGWTNAPAARLQAHKSGRGARYTRARGAAAFAYVERCADKRSALRREAALKKLPKAQKGAAVPRMERGGRALFRRIKTKRNPGLFQGQTAHKKGPGLFVFAVRAAANGQGAQMPPQNFVQRNKKGPAGLPGRAFLRFRDASELLLGVQFLPAGRSMP